MILTWPVYLPRLYSQVWRWQCVWVTNCFQIESFQCIQSWPILGLSRHKSAWLPKCHQKHLRNCPVHKKLCRSMGKEFAILNIVKRHRSSHSKIPKTHCTRQESSAQRRGPPVPLNAVSVAPPAAPGSHITWRGRRTAEQGGRYRPSGIQVSPVCRNAGHKTSKRNSRNDEVKKRISAHSLTQLLTECRWAQKKHLGTEIWKID